MNKSLGLATGLTMAVVQTAWQGCSVHHAMNVPPPVEYKNVGVGDQKMETIALLGAPKYSSKKGDFTTDYYEFTDGHHGASKIRIIPYIAAGIFTAGLSEIVFYPIESGLIDGEACSANITFDKDDKIVAFQIDSKDNGKVLWSSNSAPSSDKPIPKGNPAPKAAPATTTPPKPVI